MNTTKKTFKLLFIGNSFSDDTLQYVPEIALSYGYEDITVGRMFVGACSINMHLKHLEEDASPYVFSVDKGCGWIDMPNYSIREALAYADWDIIATMGGTGDGSKATEAESYANLPVFIRRLEELVGTDKTFAFNMTWVGESTSKHPQIVALDGNVELMYELIAAQMRDTVAHIPEIDIVSPTGTAIQNARSSSHEGKFTRDGYHLDRSAGRFIAGLTFFCAVTGCDPRGVGFFTHGMTEKMKRIAIESTENALSSPWKVTPSQL